MRHVPVLLSEVIASLALQSNFNVVDGTLGDGGHSEAMLEKISPRGKLLGIDADPESMLRAKQNLYKFGDRVIFIRKNFSDLKSIVTEVGFEPVNAVILDLGWSSPQFAERNRGFSFETDEPLDMRFNPDYQNGETVTAATIINNEDKESLSKIFKQFGEEPLHREIAEALVSKRKDKAIETTGELVGVILAVYRKKLKSTKEVPWIGGIHPATRVFQALRIATNKELDVLKAVLPQAVEVLSPNGRLAVITFHSLEDRIVKQYFKGLEMRKQVKLITKKPLVAGKEELQSNPRSRSAKLRVIEKI